MAKLRLDQLLVARGLADSRARARDAILRGHVSVSGRPVDKPGLAVDEAADITVTDPAGGYVSRAALKLIAGLDHFGFDVTAATASTSARRPAASRRCCSNRGAARVVALDVGHGQLHPRIAGDSRVTNLEGLKRPRADCRRSAVPARVIVSDVSFISLTLALPPALVLARRPGPGLFLVKPQFEAGKDAIARVASSMKPPATPPRCASATGSTAATAGASRSHRLAHSRWRRQPRIPSRSKP